MNIMNILSDSPWWFVALAVVFVVAWLVQIVLQLVVWSRPLRHLRRQQKEAAAQLGQPAGPQPGVSILVYAHNQGEALVRNLPVLLSQDYPAYEVIVIDDTSRDETQDVLTMMDQRFEHLFHSRIDERVRTMSHRKLAVLLGTKAAHYELVVMTQAQCLPTSDKWLANMVQHFQNPGVEVVLGPVAYERRASFLSRFAQYDLFHRLTGMFGLSLAVRPFAGWAQNMAFRKSTFYANRSQGFQRHLHIQPGEDDLFVSDVARGSNVTIECRADSLLTDQTSPLFLGWSMERLNRGFTSRLYAMAPVCVKVIDDLTRYLTVLPGLALASLGLVLAVQPGMLQLESSADVPSLQSAGWVLFGVALALLLIRAILMVWAESAFAKSLRLRRFIAWPLFMDLYLPLVDAWFRIKALVKRRSFGVGYIGLK